MVTTLYAAASSGWAVVGLSVMLESLFRHNNGSTADCGVLLLLWHPHVPDTVLLPEQRAAVACLAAGRQLWWRQVDDGRLAAWSRVPVSNPSALKALMKLEAFFLAAEARLNAEVQILHQRGLRLISDVGGPKIHAADYGGAP